MGLSKLDVESCFIVILAFLPALLTSKKIRIDSNQRTESNQGRKSWGYGKEESKKEHKAGSGKGGLDYCEIKENTGGSGIRRKTLKQATEQESREKSGHRGNIGTSEIRRKELET